MRVLAHRLFLLLAGRSQRLPVHDNVIQYSVTELRSIRLLWQLMSLMSHRSIGKLNVRLPIAQASTSRRRAALIVLAAPTRVHQGLAS